MRMLVTCVDGEPFGVRVVDGQPIERLTRQGWAPTKATVDAFGGDLARALRRELRFALPILTADEANEAVERAVPWPMDLEREIARCLARTAAATQEAR